MPSSPPGALRLGAHSLRRQVGRGVSIAVADSGAHPGHPHLGPLSDGVAITPAETVHADTTDRLGHGTAVTAAIQEKAPGARIHVVRLFHDQLATTAGALAAAIDWAGERGCRLVNLSLGTPHNFRAEDLAPAVRRARERGTLIIAALEHQGERWWPGSISGVLGVCLDWNLPRHSVRVGERAGRRIVYASGYPRPVPGVPPGRNLKGISFAVANATGMVALALEAHPKAKGRVATLAALTALAGGTDGSD